MSDEKIHLTLPIMQKKKTSALLWIIPLALLVLLAGGGFYWWSSQIADDVAIVESRIMTVATNGFGRVGEVHTQLGDTVQPGQVLIKLDDTMLRAQLEEARARMAAVVPGAASTATARAGEQSLLANMERSRQLEAQAMREVQHFATLHAQAQLEARRLDLQKASEAARSAARLKEVEARVALDGAKEAHTAQARARAAADADLQRFRADITMLSRAGLSEQTLAQVQGILAERLREAEARFAAATLTAPGEGRIARLVVKPGDLVQAGQVLAEIEPVRPRVLARVQPEQAQRLAVGQGARVRFTQLPGQTPVSATIEALLPPDEHGRIPVRVILDAPLASLPPADSTAQVKFITFLF